MNDEELIRFVAHGDGQVSNAVLEALQRRIGIALRGQDCAALGGPCCLLSFVWERLQISAGSFQGYGQPGAAAAWLNRIVNNELAKQYRSYRQQQGRNTKSKNMNAILALVPNLQTKFSKNEGGSTEELQSAPQFRLRSLSHLDAAYSWIFGISHPQIDQDYLANELDRALKAMAVDYPSQAKIIRMHLEPMTREEIAQALSIAPSSVSAYLSRSKPILRRFFSVNVIREAELALEEKKGV